MAAATPTSRQDLDADPRAAVSSNFEMPFCSSLRATPEFGFVRLTSGGRRRRAVSTLIYSTFSRYSQWHLYAFPRAHFLTGPFVNLEIRILCLSSVSRPVNLRGDSYCSARYWSESFTCTNSNPPRNTTWGALCLDLYRSVSRRPARRLDMIKVTSHMEHWARSPLFIFHFY